MIFRRRTEPFRFNQLATYNAERSRGLLHSAEWTERMAREQELFEAVYGSQPRLDPDLLPGYDGVSHVQREARS